MNHIRFPAVYRGLVCLPLLAACSADVVDLGGGNVSQNLARGSRCQDSTTIVEPVLVRNQAELDALQGCEEFSGDLRIEVFAGADLSPLSNLRAVGGILELGTFPDPLDGVYESEQLAAIRDEVNTIVADGYLSSLRGLEALERVGGLSIYYIAATDLTALAGLRSVAAHDNGLIAGTVSIYYTQLPSLAGLEQVPDVWQLLLIENLELESLSGVEVGPGAQHVNIFDSPKLADLGGLSAVSSLSTLHLGNTGIKNLDPLGSVGEIESVVLTNNRQLENIDRLGQLIVVEDLAIYDNPKLTHIPELPAVFALESVYIKNNTELRSITLDLNPGSDGNFVRDEPTAPSVDSFEIGDNPKLETVSLARNLTRADHVVVYDNPSLTRLDLGSLRRLETLTVDGNAILSTLAADDLETVESLTVVGNPLLSTAPLANVRSFEQELSGNAEGPDPAAP